MFQLFFWKFDPHFCDFGGQVVSKLFEGQMT